MIFRICRKRLISYKKRTAERSGRVCILSENIENRLIYLSEHFPALVLTGARQTGKTTVRFDENAGA